MEKGICYFRICSKRTISCLLIAYQVHLSKILVPTRTQSKLSSLSLPSFSIPTVSPPLTRTRRSKPFIDAVLGHRRQSRHEIHQAYASGPLIYCVHVQGPVPNFKLIIFVFFLKRAPQIL